MMKPPKFDVGKAMNPSSMAVTPVRMRACGCPHVIKPQTMSRTPTSKVDTPEIVLIWIMMLDTSKER